MNKLLVVLLAVCLFSVVSAHTFVKRDANTADDVTAQLNAVKDKFTELTNDLGKKLADAVKPEEIKKNFDDFIDVASKAIENLKPTAAPAAEEAKPAAAQ